MIRHMPNKACASRLLGFVSLGASPTDEALGPLKAAGGLARAPERPRECCPCGHVELAVGDADLRHVADYKWGDSSNAPPSSFGT